VASSQLYTSHDTEPNTFVTGPTSHLSGGLAFAANGTATRLSSQRFMST
jgi:hypothetical protein